jgi:hypothetical protein
MNDHTPEQPIPEQMRESEMLDLAPIAVQLEIRRFFARH